MCIRPRNCGKMHFSIPLGLGLIAFVPPPFSQSFVERCQDFFVIQCCDSLFWARLSSSEAGTVIATCLSPEMSSNLENYQLIVDYSFNHTFGITSA